MDYDKKTVQKLFPILDRVYMLPSVNFIQFNLFKTKLRYEPQLMGISLHIYVRKNMP